MVAKFSFQNIHDPSPPVLAGRGDIHIAPSLSHQERIREDEAKNDEGGVAL